MKLLLTACGITNPELEQTYSELTGNRKDLKVALIQTAGDPIEWVQDKDDPEKYTARQLKQNRMEDSNTYLNYKSKGYKVFNADLKQDPTLLREILEAVDVIDVGGGDVNWLLDWARKSKLDTYLRDILNKDVVYVGASAGSMLVNPDIGFTWWEPTEKWEGTDHIGLRIIDFMVQPLHGGNDVSKAKEFTERKKHLQSLVAYPWKIYLVMDGQAVKVDGDKIEHIGLGVKESI